MFTLCLCTVPDSPPGVYLYLGYSRIDAEVLKQGRMKLNDEVGFVDINWQTFHNISKNNKHEKNQTVTRSKKNAVGKIDIFCTK